MFSTPDQSGGQPGEQSNHRAKHHALRPDGIKGVPEPDEEPLEIVLDRLLDLAALDVGVTEQDLGKVAD